MRVLPKPNYDPRVVYELCISKVRNVDLRGRLRAVSNDVVTAAGDYDQLGILNRFFQIAVQQDVSGVVSRDEMDRVYVSRMVPKHSPGRPIYDRLRASSPYDVCPLCGQRVVSTLDHYLPRGGYPALVVAPHNLVPACSDCNKEKLARFPEKEDEQILHPYYDDVSHHQWLMAEVVEDIPASLNFFVHPCNAWSAVVNARIRFHFDTLKLGVLYASQAGTELANIRFLLKKISSELGPDGVRRHLTDCYESRLENQTNSWQTAMYAAMAQNDWFCQGGFLHS